MVYMCCCLSAYSLCILIYLVVFFVLCLYRILPATYLCGFGGCLDLRAVRSDQGSKFSKVMCGSPVCLSLLKACVAVDFIYTCICCSELSLHVLL